MRDPLAIQETIVTHKPKAKSTRSVPMSYSATYASKKALASGKATTGSPDVGGDHPETLAHLAAARKVVLAVIDSGAFGKRDVEVSIEGHVNDNHEPKEGYVNDFIRITIKQKA